MPRILAIDYGTKRVGLAVTDPMQIIATSLDTVHSKDLFDYIAKYAQSEEIESFVLGYPKNLDNTDTKMIQHVVGVKNKLQKLYPEKLVHLVDERFTSKIAFQAMLAGGVKKMKRREQTGNIDKVSAVIILQSFMESRS